MSQVEVMINGRPYAVACDDGQEERIRALAEYVDGKVRSFAQNNPRASEARLMLLASLVIADEFADATEALRRQRKSGPSSANGKDTTEANLAQGIGRLADRIDAIAQRLESGHI